MAVYTKLSEDEISKILSNYELGDLISSNPILDGVQNTNYKIKTPKGIFILTLAENQKPQDFKFGIDVLAFFNEHGILVPKVIKSNSEEIINEYQDKPYAITELLNGEQADPSNLEHCRKIGLELAKMHLAGKDFKQSRENLLNIDYIENNIELNAEKYNQFNPKLEGILRSELEYTKLNLPYFKKLPKGLTHSDLFPDNCFFDGNKLSGIIDFNDACTDYFNYDIATIINSWCFNEKNNLNKKNVDEFLNAYQSIRKLTNDEIFFMPAFCRLTAFSILIARLDRWLISYETPKEQRNELLNVLPPAEYLIKLKYHQDVLTADRYGL